MSALIALVLSLILQAQNPVVPVELRIQALKTASIVLEYARATQVPTPAKETQVGIETTTVAEASTGAPEPKDPTYCDPKEDGCYGSSI